MTIIALRNFTYSHDGIKAEQAVQGEAVNIPAGMIDGLVQEGCISMRPDASPEVKAIMASPENKMIKEAEENKRSVGKGPGGRWYIFDSGVRFPKGFPSKEAAETAL